MAKQHHSFGVATVKDRSGPSQCFKPQPTQALKHYHYIPLYQLLLCCQTNTVSTSWLTPPIPMAISTSTIMATLRHLANVTKQHLFTTKPPHLHQVALVLFPYCIPVPSRFLLVHCSVEITRQLQTASPISTCSTTMALLLRMES